MNASSRVPTPSNFGVQKSYMGHLWFILLLLLPTGLAPGFTTLLYLGAAVWCILITRNSDRTLIRGARQVWFFLAILFIGLLQVFSHDPYDALKDIWYFILPVLPFITGWMLAPRIKGVSRYRMILISSLMGGVWYLLTALIVLGKTSIENQYEYRSEAGSIDFLVVWGVVVALIWAREWQHIRVGTKRLLILSLIINLVAVGLSFSRTAYGIVLLGMTMAWLSSALRRHRFYLVFTGVLLALGILGLSSYRVWAADGNSFAGRMANSLSEISRTDLDNKSDIVTHWRAYEAAQGLVTYLRGGPIQRVMGQGLGAKVDLGMVMKLGGNQFQEIPTLHNGYIYLMVKVGWLGLLLFLAQIYTLWRQLSMRRNSPALPSGVLLGRVILGATVFSMLVITGPYNKGGWFSAMLLLGMIIRDIHGVDQASTKEVNL